jgi:hypothetical protein
VYDGEQKEKVMTDQIEQFIQLPKLTATLLRDYVAADAIQAAESKQNLLACLSGIIAFAGVIFTPITSFWAALAMMVAAGTMCWMPMRAEIRRERCQIA